MNEWMNVPAGIEIYYAKCQSGKIVPGMRVWPQLIN